MATWQCGSYFDFLFDRAPHYDLEILRDWFPTDDAWIGQVMTGAWDSFTGTEHVYDRLHVGAPDLSQAWQRFDTQTTNCVSGACAPTEISVGWGSTRKTYDRFRQSYTTNLLCFDQINTRSAAKQQMMDIIQGIKLITKMVWSDYLRSSSLLFADNIYIAGASMTQIAITPTTFTGQLLTINLGSTANLPTSMLSIEYLSRFYEPLQLNGYFKSKYVPNGMFKLITDPVSAQQLIQLNPHLVQGYKFSDFVQGGNLFKYGFSRAIGNFGIAWDEYPARFYHTGNGVLRRVWPYVNASATIGLKPTVANEYILAPYQYSQIWHPEAMRRLTPNLTPVSPDMPFMTRDLGGKWNFMGGTRDRTLVVKDPTTGTTCTVDNKRGNQGLLWSDFESGIKFERPELIRGILHQRDPGCVVDNAACSTAPAYVIQNLSDANPVCPVLGS
jgi:hypothetical protein